MIFGDKSELAKVRQGIVDDHFADEAKMMRMFVDGLSISVEEWDHIGVVARTLAKRMRACESDQDGMIQFMKFYNLSTHEGIVLMSLAESLLRIPDAETKKLLLSDKLTGANWEAYISESDSRWVDFATRCLAMSKGVLKKDHQSSVKRVWNGLLRRMGEPVIKQAMSRAIKMMSHYFVLGDTIDEACKSSQEHLEQGVGFSYDMLGEAAVTLADADVYFEKYKHAIEVVANSVQSGSVSAALQGVSVKLSALHPRYEFAKQEKCVPFLVTRLRTLALMAQEAGVSLTVDAEEADRLDMSLDIIEQVLRDPAIKVSWEGFGLAVQAYSKRAWSVLHWLVELFEDTGKKVEVRLVKGAYWDSEIKVSQVEGEHDYPLFTRKTNTDVSYLACAEYMLRNQHAIRAIFASHNAYTIAFVLERHRVLRVAKPSFQMLQGMGASVVSALSPEQLGEIFPRTVYAPVGHHKDLLPYLVRRILENGVNSSFVNQLSDLSIPISKLTASPVLAASVDLAQDNVSSVCLPQDIFGEQRKNSLGVCLSNWDEFRSLQIDLSQWEDKRWVAKYMGSADAPQGTKSHDVCSPFDPDRVVGHIEYVDDKTLESALADAAAAHRSWAKKPIEMRAQCLERLADLLAANRAELAYLLIHEAGKVIVDAIAELREAEDFCRYYAAMARETLSVKRLVGYTGECNELFMVGRGVMFCVSPWNFPAAIFMGQVVAALVAGNCVVAKPAEVTSIIATRMVALAYEAGIPKDVLHLLCGSGSKIGGVYAPDERIAGVVFTGSTSTAKIIQRQLAAREGAIVPFIAETGGLNALVADTTALPEQLVIDVMNSAFGSAGQRCSALRLLLVPEETADVVLTMLSGAMQEWVVGNPRNLQTDSGPVIDNPSAKEINDYIEQMKNRAKLLATAPITEQSKQGSYVIPHCFEINSIAEMEREVFGPVLHVYRYPMNQLREAIDQVNALGYGLTFGIHSRIETRMHALAKQSNAGNIYINRDIVGAVVGVNPFGGCGLSGTGPKAGGPHYLATMCHEVTITNNTTALGGDIELMQSLLDSDAE